MIKRNITTFLICICLSVVAAAVYWDLRSSEFINFDDNLYVTENATVKAGLTPEGVYWAFTFSEKDFYWHPVTWLSHMLDCELYGVSAEAHHTTNLQIHILNAILLFILLKYATHLTWPSAFVAAIFALHPINVDSVAWIAARKNVFSSFFWLLTLYIYVNYTKTPSLIRYLLIVVSFSLGLMAKSMLVTLPFLLLLLDYWPLKRIAPAQVDNHTPLLISYLSTISKQRRQLASLVLEKVPLFALSILSVYLSLTSIQAFDPVIPLETVSIELRVANALVSYISYLKNAFYPNNLALFYPFPRTIPITSLLASLVMLTAISVTVLKIGNRFPYLITGWFWFLGTLIPVSGLVQQGLWPALADRWAYIPLIGIFIMVAWGLNDLILRHPRVKGVICVAALGVLGVLCVCTREQTKHWRDSTAIFKRTVNVTDRNYTFLNNLGKELHVQGRLDDAIANFREAIKVKPDYADALTNLGLAYHDQNKDEQAIRQLLETLQLHPNHTDTYNNLGLIFSDIGYFEKAVGYFLRALEIDSEYDRAHYNLGVVLNKQGNRKQAIFHYLESLKRKPDNASAHNNLANALFLEGKTSQAIYHYRAALEIVPEFTDARANLDTALQHSRQSY